jgi:hypothetical protein
MRTILTAALRAGTEWDGNPPRVADYGDAAAWALLVFLFITLLAITCFVMALRFRPPGPKPEHELIEEVQRDEEKLAKSTPGREKGAEPWEKPADWWKPERGDDRSV